jgi:hypothetical protein
MQERTRQRVLLFSGLLVVALIVAWWSSGFSLEFMRFFAAEPGPAPAETEEPVPTATKDTNQRVTVTCSPDEQSVKVGTAATLTAAGGDGNYSWFSPGSDAKISPTTGATVTVTYSEAGTKKVTVESGSGNDDGTVNSVACTVIVTP